MNNTEWTPPPPPQEDSIFGDGTRQYYAEKIRKDTTKALVLAILSLFCCGLIFGWFAYTTAQEALTNIDVYEVEQDKRGMAQAAKVISIIGMVLWVCGIFARIFFAVAG